MGTSQVFAALKLVSVPAAGAAGVAGPEAGAPDGCDAVAAAPLIVDAGLAPAGAESPPPPHADNTATANAATNAFCPATDVETGVKAYVDIGVEMCVETGEKSAGIKLTILTCYGICKKACFRL